MSLYRRAFAAIVLCAPFAACAVLSAQTGATGAISGAITDPTGAVIVGAQVRVTNMATGDSRTLQSNDRGLYLAPLLQPGEYAVEVTKQGFKEASSRDVQVIVAETTALNIPLAPGAVTESVSVSSSNVQLETESSELGRVTNSEMVENLPLVSRNYTQIIGLNPGVAQEADNASNLGRGGGSQAGLPGGGSIMTQGATSSDNDFEMNGLSVNDMQSSMFYSAGIPIPNPDTIQEFRVQTSQYDATTGRNAGADVDLISKSGTNNFHATLFEYFRNEDLNANDWFTKNAGSPRGILRQNQYGLTASGPIVRNKFELFGSWQGTKQLNGIDASTHKIDLLPPLTNDRSAAGLGAVFGGDVGYLGAFGGTVKSDGSNITPQALALFNVKLANGQYMIPNPQKINTSKALEVQGTTSLSDPGTFNENQWMTNADYSLSDRNKIALRYFGESGVLDQTVLYSTLGNPLFIPSRFDVASLGDTFVLRPNLVNQFLIGFHRSSFQMSYHNAFTFSSLGMAAPAEEDAYPLIDIADDGFATGTTSATNFGEDEYNISDALSWTKGKHQFTFGGEFAYGRDDMSKFIFEAYMIPLTWADFLLGQPNIGGSGYSNIYESLQGLGNFARDWRYKSADGYIQDDYKITRRLTFNVGVRYEHIGDLGVANGLGGNVDLAHVNPTPPAAGSLQGFVVASNYVGPKPLPAGVEQGKNTFGFNGELQDVWNPRLGFAWLIPGTDRFLLRGGAGAYHTTPTGQMNLQMCASSPFGQWSFTEGPANAAASDAAPMPNPGAFPQFIPYKGAVDSNGNPTGNADTEFTMAAFAQNWRPPTTYHFSLGLQSRIPGGAILDVTYSGARDLHLIVGISANQASLASPSHPIRGVTTNTVANINSRKPYLGWEPNTMYQWRTGNEAWYNAMQASLSQQFRHSLQYQASFTWARLLSPVPDFTTGTNTVGPSGDQNNLRAGYGPDQNIRPLRFVLALFYSLPSPSASHHFLAETIGGWTVSTATVFQDGHQVAIGYTNTNSVYGENVDRASFAPGCTAKNLPTKGSDGYRALTSWVNKACLTTPAIVGDDGIATGFGNTPNGVLRTPDQDVADISLAKAFAVPWPKEGAKVAFRSDFFNAFNHPTFGTPNLNYTTAAAFGEITGMSTNPRVIQFSLNYSF
ncbi:MAG TPA: TonB-dependent receptor [Candidatus Sulfotelmatobacter sp.]